MEEKHEFAEYVISEEQYQKEKKNQRRIDTLLSKYRGRILNEVTKMEAQIESTIAGYFTGFDSTKTTQLMFGLFSQENFSSNVKRQLLWFIVNQFPEVYKHNKKLDDKLQGIISFRNKLAHGKVPFLNDVRVFDGKNITIYSWSTESNKTKPKPFPINNEVIKKKVKEIRDMTDRIVFIRFHLRDIENEKQAALQVQTNGGSPHKDKP